MLKPLTTLGCNCTCRTTGGSTTIPRSLRNPSLFLISSVMLARLWPAASVPPLPPNLSMSSTRTPLTSSRQLCSELKGKVTKKVIKSELSFKSNDLIINNVDIHSVDPVDPKTREALTKSVQLAIEITTKSQEAVARHQASTLEQEARGLLERQVIEDKAKAEEQRKNVLQLEAENSAIESTGSSKAESKAIAESKLIESTNEVQLSEIKANIAKITAELEVALQKQKQEAELDYKEALDNLEVTKAEELAQIEANKFQHTIEAVGKGTIKAMATAGPALQARLLKGLGLQGYLVTDGSNPINLFNTAKGLTAPMH
eukprot:PhF_6_TR38091/c5_g1_i1/m.56820/K17266/MVP; major vault protein